MRTQGEVTSTELKTKVRERNAEQKNLENAETKQRKQEKKNDGNLGRRLGFVFIVERGRKNESKRLVQ